MKKKIWIIVSIIAIIGAIGATIGYFMMNKQVKDFAKSKAEITLSSKALFDEFQSSEASANAKYVANDKTMQVEGQILEIIQNEDSTSTISLDVMLEGGDISCNLSKEESAKSAKFKKGDKITLKGQCTGYQELINKEVVMIRCGIVE